MLLEMEYADNEEFINEDKKARKKLLPIDTNTEKREHIYEQG